MAVTFTQENLRDFVITTLKKFDKSGILDISQAYNQYFMFGRVARKALKVITGSRGPARIINFSPYTGYATGPFATRTSQFTNTRAEAFKSWVSSGSNYPISRIVANMNKGEAALGDLILSERKKAITGIADYFEAMMLGEPVDDAGVDPGLWYAITPWPAGTTTPGFTGQNPVDADGTSFNDCYGIDASASKYAKWRNYAGKFTSVSASDLLKKMLEATLATNFLSPMQAPENVLDAKRQVICDNTTYVEILQLQQAASDAYRLGIGFAGNMLTFNRTPVIPLGILDDITYGQIVAGIDWDSIQLYGLAGEVMYEHVSEMSTQPDTQVVDIALTTALLAENRRNNWVLSTLSSTGTSS